MGWSPPNKVTVSISTLCLFLGLIIGLKDLVGLDVILADIGWENLDVAAIEPFIGVLLIGLAWLVMLMGVLSTGM